MGTVLELDRFITMEKAIDTGTAGAVGITGDTTITGDTSIVGATEITGATDITGATAVTGDFSATGTVNVGTGILEYADEAAAVAGGILVSGDVYRTALGALMIKL